MDASCPRVQCQDICVFNVYQSASYSQSGAALCFVYYVLSNEGKKRRASQCFHRALHGN